MRFINFGSVIFLGWYHILNKTVYSFGASSDGIGPKQHSFFITFLLHGINVWTFSSFLSARYRGSDIPLYFSLSIGVMVFGLGYIFFFRRRANQVLTGHSTNFKAILFAMIALIYATVTVYLMLTVGDYVKDKMK